MVNPKFNSTIILASGSPRRRDLLADAGIRFEIMAAMIDEQVFPAESPAQLVCRLATAKALSVASSNPEQLVLGADTIVYHQDTIIGKPIDMDHARRLLRRLSGQTHQVYTGVNLYRQHPAFVKCWHSITSVTFKALTNADIDFLLAVTNPLDKAGAYGIQDHEERFIAGYQGLRSNVMGLPIEEVEDCLCEIKF